MMVRFSTKRWLVLLGCFILLVGSISGQDLGSSNKLFKKSKKKSSSPKETSKAPEKKSSPRSKSSAKAKSSSVKSTKKDNTKETASENKSGSTPKSKFTEFKSARPSKLVITPGKPSASRSPGGTTVDERFEKLIENGNAARDDRNYDAAETAYKSARTIKPKDSRASYGLGNLFSDQQRWEEAESAYRAALQIEPANATSHIALSYVLTQPIAAPNLSERYAEAEQIARRAIELAPLNALAFDQLGVALELRGLIGAETEDAYRKAIKFNTSFAPAYAHLGRLLRRRGLLKESAAAYDNAIKRSTDVAAMILVADVMQSEQRFADSEQLLRSALNGDPKNPSALILLGRSLMAQGKFSDAERVLRSSLNVSPNAFIPNSLLGTVYIRQENFELAENALLRANEVVSPIEKRSLSQLFENVGDGFMKIGNIRNAERSYRQALSLDGENQALVSKLATAKRG